MGKLLEMRESPVAVNEPIFRLLPRHRTVPIPNSITPIDGYPATLVIFKISASKFWQVRCRVAGHTRRKSTRSQSAQVARHFARQFYEQLLADRRIATLDATRVNSDNAGHTVIAPSHPKNTRYSSAKPMVGRQMPQR